MAFKGGDQLDWLELISETREVVTVVRRIEKRSSDAQIRRQK